MKPTGRIGLASLFVAGLIVSMIGCTNVDQAVVQPPNYPSQVMFVDLANTGTSMAISYDGTAVSGSPNYGGHSSYVTIPAGSRSMRFTYGINVDTMHLGYAANKQYTLVSVYEPSNGDLTRSYPLLDQSYTFGTAAPTDTALVRFINLSSDTVTSFSTGFDFTLADTLSPDAPVTYPGWTVYYKVRAGNSHYTLVADESQDTLANNTALSGLQSTHRYSIIIYGNHANLQTLVLTEH